jgi:hypothetical protein
MESQSLLSFPPHFVAFAWRYRARCARVFAPIHVATIKWVRYTHRVPSPAPFQPREVSVDELAVPGNADAVYYWIAHDHLAARRTTNGRLCVSFES